MNDNIKILYIMGTARSGSTVLEILLAHGEHCIGVGELTAIVQDGFIENKSCSCGAAFNQCDFWKSINDKLSLTHEELRDWAYLQHKIEWHTGFLRQLFGFVRARDWQRYCSYNLRLLKVLRQVSGAAVIVDSSKYAGRALALAKMREVDLSVICLIRSPEGLMASFQKPNKDEQHPKNPWAVVRYYAFVMFSLLMALRRLNGVHKLRYEGLIANPGMAISTIAANCSINFDGVVENIHNEADFDIGHLVTGNRLRKNKTVRIDKNLSVHKVENGQVSVPLYFMKLIEAVWWGKN